MVVDVCLPPVLSLRVPVRDVHVLQCRMVVLVRVVGLQMTPVLPPVQVMGDVEVLVPVLHCSMLMMTLRPRHRVHLSSGRSSHWNRKVHRAIGPDNGV
jgi:hypothetical protein